MPIHDMIVEQRPVSRKMLADLSPDSVASGRAVVGMLTALPGGAELFRVDAICLWCTAVHVCTLFGNAAVGCRRAKVAPLRGAMLLRD